MSVEEWCDAKVKDMEDRIIAVGADKIALLLNLSCHLVARLFRRMAINVPANYAASMILFIFLMKWSPDWPVGALVCIRSCFWHHPGYHNLCQGADIWLRAHGAAIIRPDERF